MQFVQLLLTDQQVELLAAAARDGMNTPDIHSEDANELWRLHLLLQDASEKPSKYPPMGKMAASVRTLVRKNKGAAQPPRKNKRKQRQEGRRAWNIQRRKQRRIFAEEYNKAVEIMEAETAEHEANVAELIERTEKQAKFNVTDGFGQVVLEGVPAEFIVDSEGNSLLTEKKAKLHLPFRKG